MIDSNRKREKCREHGLKIIPLWSLTMLISWIILPTAVFSNYVDTVDVYVAPTQADAEDDEYLLDEAQVCLGDPAWLRVEWDVYGSRSTGFEIKVYKGTETVEENLIKETGAGNSDRQKVFSVDYFNQKPGEHEITVTVKHTDNVDDMDDDTGTIFVTELHVGETARHANIIAWNDPCLVDCGAENKLLVWHDDDEENDITFDVRKFASFPTVYYKITERLDWNAWVPGTGTLSYIYNTHGATVTGDSTDWDLKVYFGPTEAEADCGGPYTIYGITDEDYDTSQTHFGWVYLPLLDKLALAMYTRFRQGNWSGVDSDYLPNSTTGTTLLSDGRTTHNLGSSYGTVYYLTINDVKYPRATTTVPIYYWNSYGEASDLIRQSGEFESGIDTFIDGISLADLEIAYNTAGYGNPRNVVFYFMRAQPAIFSFGPSSIELSICLGDVRIMQDLSNYGYGHVTMLVTDNLDGTYTIHVDPTVTCRIEDVFDFNYFNPALGGIAPKDGATLQSAHGHSGIPSGVGTVALIRIDINGTVNRASSTKGP